MSDKELRTSLAEDYKTMADLQETIAGKESLLPRKKQAPKAKNGYSTIYGNTFKKLTEQLSKSEMKVMWAVKEQFDSHQAEKTKKTEVHMTAATIQAGLAVEGVEITLDTVRKSIKKLVDMDFIKPLSDSTKQDGKRSTYRMNPFIATGTFPEPIGKLQAEWKKLFP